MFSVAAGEAGGDGARVARMRGVWPLREACRGMLPSLISRKVFIKSSCKIRSLYKSVTLSIIVTHIKDKLTDLCGNGLLQNEC